MIDKIIRHPDRLKTESFEKPTPEYLSKDIIPENFPNQKIDAKVRMANNNEVGQENRSGVSQNNILNIGNHMEHTWSINDMEVFDDNNFIDNNEFVSEEVQKSMGSSFEEEKNTNELFFFSDIKIDEYVIMIDNEVFFVGNKEDVENWISKLAFGENDTPLVDINNIFIFKRIKIKAGIFLNE